MHTSWNWHASTEWVKKRRETRTLRKRRSIKQRVCVTGARVSGAPQARQLENTYAGEFLRGPDKRSAESQLLFAALEDQTNPWE